MTFVFLIIVLAWLYGIFVIQAANQFSKTRIKDTPAADNPTRFSIIIPFRNEENNLPQLLHSLEHLEYNKNDFEIIFCNDHSTDSSCDIIEHWLPKFSGHAQLIHSQGQGKKPALKESINKAQHPWILTTDADCIVPMKWLYAFHNSVHNTHKLCITGLVSFQNNDTFIQRYQTYENAALVALSALAIESGKALSANGANFCFHRQTFLELGAYTDHEHIASGDDEFTLHAFAQKFPGSLGFMHYVDGCVSTLPQPRISDFVSQRVRWASKSRWVKQSKVIWIQSALVLFLLSLLITVGLGFFISHAWLAAIPLLIKCLADIYFLRAISPSFTYTYSPYAAVLISISQCFLIPTIALLSIRGNYEWKGRKSHFAKH